ncbi:hypothetical protein SK128_018678 [Halocaridina rubra]|uniref:Major facilitator superfamily (MFS) profile domain-containing protein n=1 Tax=Halocaridina rubra TaxID=373956 RepID=A0AAN8XD70_HALRR
MDLNFLKVWQAGIFLLLWTAYGATYLLRKPLGVIKDDIQNDLQLSSVNLGWIDSAFLLPYAVVSLMFGHVGDKLGSRLTLSGGLIIAAAATMPMLFCQSYVPLLILLVISGAGQALCWPATCSLLSRWYSDESRNSIFGMFGTCCFVGGLAGTGLAVYLQALYGWRSVFLPPGSFVALIGLLVFFIGRLPEEVGITIPGRAADQASSSPSKSSSNGQASFLTIFRIPIVPEISIAMFCVKAVRYALMMWLPLYFLRSLGYSKVSAGLASTSFEVGGVVGSILTGMIVDRWMKGRAVLVSAIGIGGSALVLVIFMMTSSWGPIFHVAFLTLTGALNCGPDILLAGSVSADIGERAGGLALGVTSVVNGMGSLGTVLEGPMVSAAAAWFGWASMVPLMILLSCVGAVAAFRANSLQGKLSGMNIYIFSKNCCCLVNIASTISLSPMQELDIRPNVALTLLTVIVCCSYLRNTGTNNTFMRQVIVKAGIEMGYLLILLCIDRYNEKYNT